MSTDIDAKTSNDDIFSNPLEAFPEFIDEPAATEAESSESENTEKAAVSTPEPEKTLSSSRLLSSSSFTDPLDTIEEVDISSLSSASLELSFTEDDSRYQEDDDSANSFSTKTNLTFGSIEYEDVAVRKIDGYADIDDSVPDEASVTEEVSVDDFLSSTSTETEEIDLDDFLGDSSSPSSATPSANVTEEISLDDFGVDFGGFDASAIDAIASSARQEKNDIENAPAIEMELEFDDEFVLETKANPEDDIDFDFEALMAGESVPVPQQASGDELLDNFDDIFDNIVDETAPSTEKPADNSEFDPSAIEEVSLDDFGIGSSSSVAAETGESLSEQKIVYDEVSEFDDLLSSFSDETHVEVAEKQQTINNKTGPHDYNIIVIMDETDETPVAQAPVIEETEEEEDFNISLFKTDEEAEMYRKHDAYSVSDSQEHNEESVPAVNISSSSDSFEDISLDDFGVTFTDETPEADKEPAPDKEPVLEEKPVLEEPASEEESISQDEPPVTEEAMEDLPDLPDLPENPFEDEESGKIIADEYEDTTSDNKINVDMSENYGYNEDNTEDTSNMTDENKEEMTDTMNEGLLEKIVSELSVLRNEMQTLRDEVQTLKGGVEPASEPAVQEEDFTLPEEPVAEEPVIEEPVVEEQSFEETVIEEPVSEETVAEETVIEESVTEEAAAEDIPLPEADPFAAPQEAGGFFSGDDDDETIALSGDELNNILNSADFTHEDGSNFGMEAPEGSILPDGLSDEVSDVPPDDISLDIPAEETPSEESAFEASIEDPVLDEPAAETSFDIQEETPAEEASIDDFNTDLPSLKEETETAPAEESAPADDGFSLDDLDIPEPSVEESSIADIDIDAPETETKAEDDFSLDDFDIPEPSVEESSIADINIDEPSSEIAAEEPAISDDADFYDNSDSSAISEEDVSNIADQENLEEPVLDDIDFGMDEPQADDISIPTGESLVVDSSSTDFLEEDDPTLDEQLTSEKVDYLNEEASVDDLGAMPEIEDVSAVEGMEDSLEVDTIATSEDETPADDMFASQWEAEPSAETIEEPAPSFVEETGEEIVHAAASFDDPIDFGIEETPAEEPDVSLDEGISFDEPEQDIPTEEPVSVEPVAEEPVTDNGALDDDIKQEVKSVLKYMDQLLENLPEDKIAEFAQSEHFETYKKLFNELGLV
ncbi:MAG: hypothetical protein KBT02_07610 [Treponema sp.]|nr:hypothetical protein [Candidatus Treponema caballi]